MSATTVNRMPKPCLHKVAEHQHGTYACYVLDSCRCRPCASARSQYDQSRLRQKAYGRWDNYVDAEPARAHIAALVDQGMGLKRIVAVSEISQGLLWKLVYGRRKADGSRTPSKRIKKETHERILAIKLDLAPGARLDISTAIGTPRRLQALIALGWSQSKLGKRLDVLPCNMTPLVRGTRGVTVGMAQKVAELYDDLSMTLPPNETHRDRISVTRARNHAKANGWLPPLALDDEHLDDADLASQLDLEADGPILDDQAIWRRMRGDQSVKLTKAEKEELARLWIASGRSMIEMTRVAGITKPERYARLADGAA